MSYSIPPSILKSSPPTTSDDITKGYVEGSVLIIEGTPRAVYICTKNTLGAATWVSPGGISSHDMLTVLGWSASGHTGTATSVATFNSVGQAENIQPTLEGSVLTYVGGILTFATMAATVATLSARTIDMYPMNEGADFADPTVNASLEVGSIVDWTVI
jgi:hypothetical protein